MATPRGIPLTHVDLGGDPLSPQPPPKAPVYANDVGMFTTEHEVVLDFGFGGPGGRATCERIAMSWAMYDKLVELVTTRAEDVARARGAG